MISGKMLQLFEVLLGIASGKTQELNPALLSTSKCLVNCHAWLPCTWFVSAMNLHCMRHCSLVGSLTSLSKITACEHLA